MNRFDLEEDISNLNQIGEDIETMIYAIGDSANKYSEDQLLNMLIGIKQLHDTRYEKMWASWNEYVKQNTKPNITI